MKIKIIIGGRSFDAELNETETAKRIYEALPIEATGSLWGDEIYFKIPLEMENESPQYIVEVGDLAYWPPGSAFCIFFGRTPASTDERPKPASPVTVVGRIKAQPEELKGLNLNIELKKA
jgi:hypothetical protein